MAESFTPYCHTTGEVCQTKLFLMKIEGEAASLEAMIHVEESRSLLSKIASIGLNTVAKNDLTQVRDSISQSFESEPVACGTTYCGVGINAIASLVSTKRVKLETPSLEED